MTNNELLKKMSQDMHMRNFSKYTYDFYLRKTKEMTKYFNKPLQEVTIEELRNFFYVHLLQERKLADKTVNHYNSVIRFVYEVTLDKLVNKKQLPMRKVKKKVFKVLTKEELSTFFNCVDDHKFKTIFMLVYGSGLRIGEASCLKLPQFTTMNVIDGQAGLILYASLIFYSLTINNILNIIILLILAGVSIGMLTEENGILKKAGEASEKTKIATEEEQRKMAIIPQVNYLKNFII